MEIHQRRDERGAAAVEFALISLIMITLVCVIFQFAVYMWAFQAASHGAREGARAWAVNPCGAGNAALVISRVGSAARPASISATATFAKGTGNVDPDHEPGDSVTVEVKMKARELGFNLVPGWDYDKDITKTAVARVEDTKDCP